MDTTESRTSYIFRYQILGDERLADPSPRTRVLMVDRDGEYRAAATDEEALEAAREVIHLPWAGVYCEPISITRQFITEVDISSLDAKT